MTTYRTKRSIRFRRLLLAFPAPLWLAATLHAQPTTPPDEAARKRESQRVATETFLDRSRPERERLATVPQIGYPDEETFAALLTIGADRGESDAIRWEALRKHRFDDKWLDLVLKILDDPQDGGEFLDWKLTEDINRRATFKLPAEIRQRIQATWRRLLDDPRDHVRLSAYRVLVANHDPVAVNRLSESLRARAQVPIPLHEAIELLDLDGSINHISALRPYLSNRDPKVRARAARALAVDPESRPRIVEMVTNPETPTEVRVHALRALSREDVRFGSYAIPLVENKREDGDVRFAAMRAFAGRMNYAEVETVEQIRFAQAVEQVAVDRSLGSRVRKEARELHEYLKEHFPEVKRFYERR